MRMRMRSEGVFRVVVDSERVIARDGHVYDKYPDRATRS